jgi:SAM-dependent methyltransferase
MTTRTAFDPVAADYDTYRPEYPEALFQAIERYAGPLTGATVLDLASGTGIAARALADHGAHVVSTDLGADMLRVLVARTPTARVVRSRGEALPFRDEAFDLVACATAWHWISAAARGPEALRALRPGGALAIWWAFGGLADEALAAREREVYERWRVGQLPLVTPTPEVGDETKLLPQAGFVDVETTTVESTRTVSVDEHIGHLSTHSPVLALRSDLPKFQDELRRSFAGEAVVEEVHCHVVLARKPA